jgi:hypothetical protein
MRSLLLSMFAWVNHWNFSPTSPVCSAGAAAADDAAAAGSGAAGGNGTSTSSASLVPVAHCIPTIVPNSRHASVFLTQQIQSAAVEICVIVPLERLQSILYMHMSGCSAGAAAADDAAAAGSGAAGGNGTSTSSALSFPTARP